MSQFQSFSMCTDERPEPVFELHKAKWTSTFAAREESSCEFILKSQTDIKPVSVYAGKPQTVYLSSRLEDIHQSSHTNRRVS